MYGVLGPQMPTMCAEILKQLAGSDASQAGTPDMYQSI